MFSMMEEQMLMFQKPGGEINISQLLATKKNYSFIILKSIFRILCLKKSNQSVEL